MPLGSRTTGIILILTAVILLTAAQIGIKNRLSVHGQIPLSARELAHYVYGLVQDWKMWLALGVLIMSAVGWYAALSRLPLSMAFPFAALSYPLIFLGAVLFLGEAFSWAVLAGNLLIMGGVVITSLAAG